jgi:L-serine dehydratase
LAPVLPVLDSPARKPQLFDTMARWREVAAERGLSLAEAAVQYEMDASGWSRGQVVDYMRMVERAMHRQTHAVYEEALDIPTTPFRPNMAAEWARHMASPRRLTDGIMAQTLKWAYGAGAGIPGVPTVAGPMGSGGGYIHAALWAVKEAHGFSDDALLAGLFVAAGVGAIAYTRTEPTGEVTGCSGETGICGAMAAAGIVAMAGASTPPAWPMPSPIWRWQAGMRSCRCTRSLTSWIGWAAASRMGCSARAAGARQWPRPHSRKPSRSASGSKPQTWRAAAARQEI